MRTVISIGAALFMTSHARAQDVADPQRDTYTVAIGAGVTPRYEGADDYLFTPVGALRARVSGYSISTVGTSVFVDVIPSAGGPGTKFVLGPMAHVGLNRASLRRTRDPRVRALGKIPVSVDVGAHFGVSRTGVITSEYDNLTLDVAVSHDVTGVHDSLIVTPSINYGTPLSRKVFVGLSASATHVGNGYAQRYFGVTPAQAVASGLPRYTPNEGFKDLTFGTVANLSLTGDLRRGLSAFALGSYARLLGDFGRSPVVRDRTQLFGAIGLAYTF